MSRKPDYYYRQSAAVPVRRGEKGLDVLLITSRNGKRWIVPKGIVEPDLTPAESALKEAWEEAGIRGALVLPEPIGTYRYAKWGGTCSVEVFVMEVQKTSKRWPERERQRRWLPLAKAADELHLPELGDLVRRVPALMEGSFG